MFLALHDLGHRVDVHEGVFEETEGKLLLQHTAGGVGNAFDTQQALGNGVVEWGGIFFAAQLVMPAFSANA